MKKHLILVVCLLTGILTIGRAQQAFRVSVTGKGAPVLLFPGFACTGEVFDETVKALSAHYECHSFTFAGFGGVPAIDTPWLPQIREQVVAYVKQQQLDKPIIIGHSIGGTLGFWLAATEPSLFGKLIAVDALPCNGAVMIPNFNAAKVEYETPYTRQMMQTDTASFRKQARMQVGFMMVNTTNQPKVVEWMMQADRKTYVYGYIDLLKLDLREDMSKVQIPVVVLAATNMGRAVVENTYNQQLAKVANKTIHYADGAGHFVMYDAPEWYLQKINENIR